MLPKPVRLNGRTRAVEPNTPHSRPFDAKHGVRPDGYEYTAFDRRADCWNRITAARHTTPAYVHASDIGTTAGTDLAACGWQVPLPCDVAMLGMFASHHGDTEAWLSCHMNDLGLIGNDGVWLAMVDLRTSQSVSVRLTL